MFVPVLTTCEPVITHADECAACSGSKYVFMVGWPAPSHSMKAAERHVLTFTYTLGTPNKAQAHLNVAVFSQC